MAIVSAENVTVQAQGFGNLPAFRQLGLLVGLALSVALGVTVAMWSQTPNYSLLYGNLSAKDLAQVTSVLSKSNIEYRLEGGSGVVMVPADQIHEARMKLASQGMQIGGGSGYELLEKEQGLGSSSFLQKARYHRAQEGELAKSIGNLNFVEGARVHLAIPKQSAFARKHSRPTASVILNIIPGRVLDDSQVAGIVNMVASSIPGLESDNVTVIDHRGRLLSSTTRNSNMMLSSSQFEYTRKLKNVISIASSISSARSSAWKVYAPRWSPISTLLQKNRPVKAISLTRKRYAVSRCINRAVSYLKYQVCPVH
jgi:flagellar M-ring protein FliF